MTRKQAESLESGAHVVIDAGTDHEQRARLWCADAKWTADMRGMAVVQRVDENDRAPSWAPRNGYVLVSRRCLTVAT